MSVFCASVLAMRRNISGAHNMRNQSVNDYPKIYYVYIMTNKSKTLYTGVTSNLQRRVWKHKQKLVKGFTKKYNIDRLVFFEETQDIRTAITPRKTN